MVMGESETLAEQSGFHILNVVWTVAVSVVAGYLTAWIAGRHEYPHASTVGFLLVAASVVSMRQQALVRPSWYEITVAGCGPISALIGCALRILTKPIPKKS